MKLSKKAQSIVESGAMIALIGLAMAVGGKYMISSINSQMRSVENHVNTGKGEIIMQAGVPGLAIDACDCPATMEPTTCGAGSSNPNDCAFQKELWIRPLCNPPGCEATMAQYGQHVQMWGCFDNDPPTSSGLYCCTPKSDLACGAAATRGTNPDGTCNDGFMNRTRTCTVNNTVEDTCEQDGACTFTCTGSPVNASYCPGAGSRLTSTQPTSHIGYSTCPADASGTCLAACNSSGFFPDVGGGRCTCGVYVVGARRGWGGNNNTRYLRTKFQGTLFDTDINNQNLDRNIVLAEDNIDRLRWRFYLTRWNKKNHSVGNIKVMNFKQPPGPGPHGLTFFWLIKGSVGRNTDNTKSWNNYPTSGGDRCPSFVSNMLARTRTSNDNHSENIIAYAVWKTVTVNGQPVKIIDYIQFLSCSADTSGGAGLMPGIGIEVTIEGTCP